MVDQENLLTLAKLMQILREPSGFGMRTFKLVLLDTGFLEDATLTVTHFTEESRKTHLFFNLQMDIHQLKPLLVQKYYLLQQGCHRVYLSHFDKIKMTCELKMTW